MWSRAAQTRCRCTSGLHTASTIARRTTTATSKRGIKASDVFTACYSAMFATAAVVDAKYKDKRRKDWDRAIEEARGGSNTTEEGEIETSSSSQTDTTSNFEAERPNGWTQIADTITHHTGITTVGPRNNMTWACNGTLKPPLGQETLLETRLKVLAQQVNQESGQFGKSEEAKNGPIRIDRNPKTDAHIRKMGEMMSEMVSRLRNVKCEYTQTQSTQNSELSPNYERQLKNLNKRINLLDYEAVSYPDYSLVFSYTKERLALNHAILTVLRSEGVPIDLKVAKVCWNLLASRAAPDITTFNLLILHFTQLKQHDLANVVVDTLLHESRLRPDETTIVAILEHYIASNNKTGFNMAVRRMRGVEGDMRLKRRSLWHLCLPEVQEWALNNKVIHRNFHLHEKVVRTQAIFDSLIVGAFKFSGLSRTMMYLRAAIREGFTVRYWIFEALASICSCQRNWVFAEDLLRIMLSQWKDVKATMPKFGTTTRQWLARLISLSRDASDLALDQIEQRFVGYEGPLRSLLEQLQGPAAADPRWVTKLSMETQFERIANVNMMLKQALKDILLKEKIPFKDPIPSEEPLTIRTVHKPCALVRRRSSRNWNVFYYNPLEHSEDLKQERRGLPFAPMPSLENVSMAITDTIHQPARNERESF